MARQAGYLCISKFFSQGALGLELLALCSCLISLAFQNGRPGGSAAAFIRAPLLTSFWHAFGWDSLGIQRPIAIENGE